MKRLVGSVRAGPDRAVRPPRRVGDRARQRRHDGVLGRRHVRADRPAQRAPRVRRVLVEVRRRQRAPRRISTSRSSSPREPGDHPEPVVDDHGRPLRPHPQRDLHRRGDGPAPAGRRRTARSWPSTPPRPPAGCRGTRPQVDVYYFAPQKCFASDGGLWIAACSPAAVERIERITAERPMAAGVARPRHRPRQQPPRPDLQHPGRRHAGAVRRPSCAGCSTAAGSTGASSGARLVVRPPLRVGRGRGRGRRRSSPIRPSARRSSARSISTTRIDAAKVNAALRANGIVDTDSYRKLGRNQLRIGMFPAVDPADVEALTACIDHLVEHHREVLAP